MEYVIGVLAAVGVLAVIFISGAVSGKNREKNFKNRLKEEFGKPLTFPYSEERLASLKGYYFYHLNKEEGDFFVDDITWNDIEGERIYRLINHCYSSAGDEYLYYLLRAGFRKDKEEENRFIDEGASFFAGHEKEREAYQVLFAKMGRTGRYSVYKYLELLGQLYQAKKYSKLFFLKFVLIWILLAGSIAFAIIKPLPGVLFLAVFLSASCIFYYKSKGEIEPFLVSFEYMIRMLKTTERFHKSSSDVFKSEMEELWGIRKRLSAISSSSYVFLKSSSSSMGGGGDLSELFLGLVKIITHADLFLFQRMLRQVVNHEEDIDRMITLLGRMEATISIASFREGLGNWCVPEFDEEGIYEVKNAVHPLIENAVPNDFSVKSGMLITGSNASGKSTFLRTAALCALLAQTIHTVPAKEYHAPHFRILTSISLKDNPERKESYYMVEIKAIRRMLEAYEKKEEKLLIVIDEVLRGTNTVERIAAASEILKYFAEGNTTVFAATHDGELTYLLEEWMENYHFEEEIKDHDITFPYLLLPGRAESRNAIKLLHFMGYPGRVVECADEKAKEFLVKGDFKP